ncbi:MAG TPA: hypothetical protein V6C97_00165 [Oculatellaceae cyanobacterium]
MRKYTRDDIARAYNTFDLPFGTPLADVMLKYRQLAPATHPDKFFDPAQKKKAEDKLKKINHAKDVLNDHFKGPKASHIESADCICRPTKTTAASNQERAEAEKRAAAAEAKKKAAEAAAKQAALKAAEEARKKAEAEAAEKARAEKAAAEEAARRAAQAEADALAAAAFGNKAAESVQTGKETVSTRWLYAKACAAIFLGIMSVTCVADLFKGHSHSNLSESVTPAPPQETKTQEDDFYRKEADRTAYDAKHRYDPEIAQCLAQIADDKKRIDELQQELDRLKNEPASAESETRMRSLYGDIYSISSCWKAANNHLDELAKQHPEVADCIPQHPAPPSTEAPEMVPVRARGTATENQSTARDTEKT